MDFRLDYPFRNQVTIRYNNPTQTAFTVTIYTADGKEVKSVTNSSQDVIIGSADMSAGLYFYKIEQDGRLIASDKLILE